MTDYSRIPAVIMRGGTSKGVFLRVEDLPADPKLRDQVILSIFGSPDPRQVDGLGGADPLTSKVALIGPSSRPGVDVDYTAGYVGIDKAFVDYEGNCGNISQAVGPFAVDQGLVPAVEPITIVRIFNTNTSQLIEAEVPVRDGRAWYEGDFAMFGVPGTAARIAMNFAGAAGSKTGKLLPTGNVTDIITLDDGRQIPVSLVDAAAPAVFVRASDLGYTGAESPDDTRRDPGIVAVLDELRRKGSVLMGLAKDPASASPAIPKVAMVAPPRDYTAISGTRIGADQCDLLARTLALGAMHKAYAITGGICLATAALLEGSVVNSITGPQAKATGEVRFGHPSGVSSYLIEIRRTAEGFELGKTAVAGSARCIMEGVVRVHPSALKPV